MLKKNCQTKSAKVFGLKGNSPEHKLKSLNLLVF